MSENKAPQWVIDRAWSAGSDVHPVRLFMTGVCVGWGLITLGTWNTWASVGAAFVVGGIMTWSTTWSAARWRVRRRFRRNMNAMGWCWYCRGDHLAEVCELR